ncbi:MAG: M36 family metallopeptidase, partial [Bacteroidia bacterium]|nr:M36 family metallopeptidase [Bacteroidia bacterium]
LTGGAVTTNCIRHYENPSEGWCDWLGIMLTIKPEDAGTTPRAIANYLTNQGANGGGIRNYPYSTNTAVNPLTYGDVPSQIGIHAVGAVWGEFLWEVTWTLIDNYGFDPDVYNFTGDSNQDAGNIMALAIIIEALKITPCQPGFVVARDAILMAAEAIYGADVVCLLWPAFAKRGLGFIADQGDSDVRGDERISFRIPSDGPIFEAEYDDFCFYGGLYGPLTGGLPLGGTYSGPGVLDSGDGQSYYFDPAEAGIGIHTVTYTFPETICSPANTVTKDDIVVNDDTESPSLECLADVSRRIDPDEDYYLEDFTQLIDVSDSCPGMIQASQFPLIGTQMELGITEIEITVQDTAGNESSCTFEFLLVLSPFEDDGLEPNILTFYPNPATDEITLINTTEK